MMGLVLLNLFGWFISAGINGGGGLSVTATTNNVSAVTTTIPVVSTAEFLSADTLSPAYIVIDDEVIKYTGKNATHFTECTRGATDQQIQKTSAAKTHAVNSKVSTLEVQVLNSMVGYNIVSSSETFGFLDGIWMVARFLWNLPKLLTWDFVFFHNNVGVYIRYLLMAVSAGITIGLIIAVRKG
jgi:hypothetical protein